MTTTHLDASEVDSYDYLIVGGGTAVSQSKKSTPRASLESPNEKTK